MASIWKGRLQSQRSGNPGGMEGGCGEVPSES